PDVRLPRVDRGWQDRDAILGRGPLVIEPAQEQAVRPAEDREPNEEAGLDPGPREELLHPRRRPEPLRAEEAMDMIVLGEDRLREDGARLGRVSTVHAEHHDLIVEVKPPGHRGFHPPDGRPCRALEDAWLSAAARARRLDRVDGAARL